MAPPDPTGKNAYSTVARRKLGEGNDAVIANAIYDAVGARLFQLPMTPARIRQPLKAAAAASAGN